MSGYAEGILVVLAINIILAYGAFIPLAAGQLNLGLAGFAAIGAYASAYISNNYDVAPVAAIVSGALAAGMGAAIASGLILRSSGIYLALATFAVGQIVQGWLLNAAVVGGAAGYPVSHFVGLPVVIACTVSVGIGMLLLSETRFWVVVSSVRGDEQVADLFGVNVHLVKVAAYTLGSFVAGLGGAIYAHYFSYIEPQYFNITFSITVVISALLGGTQTILGPIAGAAVFTLLPELFRGGAQWRYVAFAAVIIVLMAFRPQGVVDRDFCLRCLRRLCIGRRAAPHREPQKAGVS